MDYCTSRCVVTAMKLSPKLDQSLCLEVFAEDGRDIGTTGVSCLAGVDFARFCCTCSNRPQLKQAWLSFLSWNKATLGGQTDQLYFKLCLNMLVNRFVYRKSCPWLAGRIIIFHRWDCHATALVGPDRSTHLSGDVIVGLYCCIVVFQKHQACP